MKSLREQPMTTSKYLVFDIKRFAVHDGEGLRTTVFFKGCPLRCRWCQNPEGLLPQRKPIYLENKCMHCRNCEKQGAGKIVYQDRPVFIEDDLDEVFKYCPTDAIQYDSSYYSLEELVDKVMEDEVFFKYGGGVTVSGGEPFMQQEKLIQLLKELHPKVHTAIETSLYTSLDLVKQAAPYLDQIYCDLKIEDDKAHREATGVSNTIIKENLAYLLTSKHKDKVIVRTPLIPGYTCDDDNIKSIASYLYSLYPEVRYELLNYNPLASAKYDLTEFEYGVKEDQKAYSQEELSHYYQIVSDSGIKNMIKGD